MVRYVVYSMEWGSDSSMSAELTQVASDLSEHSKHFVQIVGTAIRQDLSLVNGVLVPGVCQLVTTFEIVEPDDDDDDDDDDTTPGLLPGRSH